MSTTVDIKFEPDNAHVVVPAGTTILDAARLAAIPLAAPCGGHGVCGKCRCVVIEGDARPIGEDAVLTDAERAAGVCLACRTAAQSDLTVLLPAEVRTGGDAILEDAMIRRGDDPFDPATRAVVLNMAPPSLADQRSDAVRLRAALAEAGIRVTACDATGVLPGLPTACRESDFTVTAVEREGLVLGVHGGADTALYGVAVDLGSTTVVAYLMDLSTGRRLGAASDINPQVAYGDDLVSRISFIDNGAEGLSTLGAAARDVIARLVGALCADHDVDPRRVYDVRVVGNAAMTHILLGANPRNIPLAPYIPCFQDAVTIPARELGWGHVAPGARVTVLPCIAGWVGADTVGVVLATRMHRLPGVRLAIDIGTNGEMVAGGAGRLLACSTAAGPAFEGASIRHGMRGAPGAIDHVDYDEGVVRVTTIGREPARGICGTGLIDAAAVLLRCGVLLDTGRMLKPDSDEARALPPAVAERLVQLEDGPAFVLASGDESALKDGVLLTQGDVRQLQLAKGAIAAGVGVLLSRLGVTVDAVEEVLLAGAFGAYVNAHNAAAIGLFPPELGPRARAVGNAAGAGALMALASREELAAADRIADEVEYVELASLLEFDMLFADQMMFPEQASDSATSGAA